MRFLNAKLQRVALGSAGRSLVGAEQILHLVRHAIAVTVCTRVWKWSNRSIGRRRNVAGGILGGNRKLIGRLHDRTTDQGTQPADGAHYDSVAADFVARHTDVVGGCPP